MLVSHIHTNAQFNSPLSVVPFEINQPWMFNCFWDHLWGVFHILSRGVLNSNNVSYLRFGFCTSRSQVLAWINLSPLLSTVMRSVPCRFGLLLQMYWLHGCEIVLIYMIACSFLLCSVLATNCLDTLLSHLGWKMWFHFPWALNNEIKASSMIDDVDLTINDSQIMRPPLGPLQSCFYGTIFISLIGLVHVTLLVASLQVTW